MTLYFEAIVEFSKANDFRVDFRVNSTGGYLAYCDMLKQVELKIGVQSSKTTFNISTYIAGRYYKKFTILGELLIEL